MVKEMAQLIENEKHERETPLDNCVGFLDCTGIAMCRSRVRSSFQRPEFSIEKQIICLINYAKINFDGFMHFIYIFSAKAAQRASGKTTNTVTRIMQAAADGMFEAPWRVTIYGCVLIAREHCPKSS